MKNEAMNYAEAIAEEIKDLYYAEPNEENEENDFYSYVCDALDVEYTLDSNKSLIGVILYVTLGGPTCYIDTRRQQVVCHWGTDSGFAYLDSDICDEINSLFECDF